MKKKIFYIVLTMVISGAVVVGLFLSSEHIMKKENPFVRRFMPHPVTDNQGVELPYNSYYIAGINNGAIYLGNHSAPLHGLQVNIKSAVADTIVLTLEDVFKYPFQSIKWRTSGDSILLHDSGLGLFYKGSIAKKILVHSTTVSANSYSSIAAIDHNKIVLRAFNDKKNNVTLGLLDTESATVTIREALLDEEGQPQDLFSNDGILLYNEHLDKIIYVFYYKNQSFILDSELTNRQVLRTIDTISRPNFKIEYLKQRQELKMSKKPVYVNKAAATAGNYLFILSDRMGRNERRQMYAQADIIDVYDVRDFSYSYSFYMHHFKNTSITEIYANGDYLIGKGGTVLNITRFKKSLY